MDPTTSFKLPVLVKKRFRAKSLEEQISDALGEGVQEKTEDFDFSEQAKGVLPSLGMKLNPGYRLEFSLAKSEIKRALPGEEKKRLSQGGIDKLFYRKRDYLVKYAESFFRNKVLYSKK